MTKRRQKSIDKKKKEEEVDMNEGMGYGGVVRMGDTLKDKQSFPKVAAETTVLSLTNTLTVFGSLYVTLLPNKPTGNMVGGV
ncbi:hypothetical protein V1478_016390 [Vespula squamosa]|uniref:Uncharacterized protein n=1 Tax=Vespula squamosa TaxID=30214 RepID=A0ABD1ZZQ0_VESSQ